MVILIKQCNHSEVSNQNPTTVGYRELIEKTDEYSIYRDCKYKLESIAYDTVPNRTLSTIETPSIETHPIPDKVDLNKIFDPNNEGDTDWNFTELSEDEISYLDSIGVYWDERCRCYRKHK